MILALLLLAATPQDPPAYIPPDCSYDLDEMLSLDRQAFDQDETGGWRPLSDAGCHAEAAELIREWRHEKRDHKQILYWHEGQMRAFAGQTEDAVALMALTYKTEDLNSAFGWNYYADGTIAFLTRDREGLALAMERLAALPVPDDLKATAADGSTTAMDWPPNMHVLQALERCWDLPYAEVYMSYPCFGLEEPEEEDLLSDAP